MEKITQPRLQYSSVWHARNRKRSSSRHLSKYCNSQALINYEHIECRTFQDSNTPQIEYCSNNVAIANQITVQFDPVKCSISQVIVYEPILYRVNQVIFKYIPI